MIGQQDTPHLPMAADSVVHPLADAFQLTLSRGVHHGREKGGCDIRGWGARVHKTLCIPAAMDDEDG